MKKYFIILLIFSASFTNQAIAELTYTAFTKEGRALVNRLSMLKENEKFRIIFISDKKSDYDLITKINNGMPTKQTVKKFNQMTLPKPKEKEDGTLEGMWYQLGGKGKVTIELSNSEDNIRLEFRKYALKNNSQMISENVKYLGEVEKVDFIPYPDLKDLHFEDDSLTTVEPLKVRSLNNNFIPKKYKSSVVLIKTADQIGAGFMVANDKILTNWHVVKNKKRIGVRFKAKLYNKISLKMASVAEVVLTDKEKDLALLKLGEKTPFEPFKISTSEDIDQGYEVSTFGHPYGLNWLYTKGNVSARETNFHWEYENSKHKAKLVYITQLPIDKGSSGGPLLDKDGEVIGIVTSFLSQNNNLNVAVSSDDIREFIKRKIIKRIRNRSIKINAKIIDINNDGIADGKLLDIDKDGHYETELITKDSGSVEHSDMNRNGVIDRRVEIIPNYGGGKDRIIYKDEDEDGEWDYIGIDFGNNNKINDVIKG